jgi:hypothetical protein
MEEAACRLISPYENSERRKDEIPRTPDPLFSHFFLYLKMNIGSGSRTKHAQQINIR